MQSLAERWEARLAREGLAAEPPRLSLSWSGRGGGVASMDRVVHKPRFGSGGCSVTMHDTLASDRARMLISVEHQKLGAAVWRFPFRERSKAYRAKLQRVRLQLADGPRGKAWTVDYVEALVRHRERSERTIVRLLAEGATSRKAAKRARVSLSAVVALRRAVMDWEDPDDER